MANEEHILFFRDEETWNEFRQANPSLSPDLSKYDFDRDAARNLSNTACASSLGPAKALNGNARQMTRRMRLRVITRLLWRG